MPNSSDSLLQAIIQKTCNLAEQLISVLKLEAEVLTTPGSETPANFIEAQDRFLAALAEVLQRIQQQPAALNEQETAEAFQKVQELIADIKTAPMDSLIAAHPEAVEFYHKRAGILFELGRDEAAKKDYLFVLSKQPNHYPALNDLGILLMETGNQTEAKHQFLQAVQASPTQAAAHINLADLMLAQADYDSAKIHYQLALDLDPDLNKAHQGLSLTLTGLGDAENAAIHRQRGFQGQSMLTWAYRGTGIPIPLIVLGSAYGGNIPFNHILDKRRFQTTVILSEYFEVGRPLPPHKLIINLIGDADLSKAGLDAAEALLTQENAPIINHPTLVRPTARLINSRRLGALPGVKTPRMTLWSRQQLKHPSAAKRLAECEIEFPLLLRTPGYHTGEYFERVENQTALTETVDRLPGENLLVIEMLDTRNIQGNTHKFRVMFVDGKLYPLHLAISNHWKVHYFSADMANQPQYRALEEAFLKDMPTLLGSEALAALERIPQVLGLDYGGIDFAIASNGEVLLFEANATMLVPLPNPDEKWNYRREATHRILEAINNMIITRATSPANHP